MSWVAVGIGGFNSLAGAIGGGKAAKKREQAIGSAIGAVNTGYDQAIDYLDPRYEQEQSALDRVNALLGLTDEGFDYEGFRSMPGYEFSVEEAQRAIERSAAGRGGLASGNTLIALQDRAQGMADSQFYNYLAAIMGLSQQGVDSNLANLAVERGVNIGNLRVGAGEARASGIEDQTNSLIGFGQDVAGIYGAGGWGGPNWLAPQTTQAPYRGMPRTPPFNNSRVSPSGW